MCSADAKYKETLQGCLPPNGRKTDDDQRAGKKRITCGLGSCSLVARLAMTKEQVQEKDMMCDTAVAYMSCK